MKRRRKRNAMSYGTSYFVSRGAAERYYKDYHYEDTKAAVSRKIAEGEIHIGKPPLKAGQRLTTIDGGKRYQITEDNPAAAIPRGKWVNAKVRITRAGKIEAQLR